MSEMLQDFFPNFNRYGKTFDSQHAHICSLNRNVCGLLKENRQLRKRLKKIREAGPEMPGTAARRHLSECSSVYAV